MLPFKTPRVTFKKPSVKLGNLLLVPTIEKSRYQGELLERYIVDRNGCWIYIPPGYVNKHGEFQRWKFVCPWILNVLFLAGIVLSFKVLFS